MPALGSAPRHPALRCKQIKGQRPSNPEAFSDDSSVGKAEILEYSASDANEKEDLSRVDPIKVSLVQLSRKFSTAPLDTSTV